MAGDEEYRPRPASGRASPMEEPTQQADPLEQAAQDQGQPRKCVACGYNLFGLGEAPRCPECGLVNIPEVFRREVWELVDSGKWFFSSIFNPFAKRPPGWWWALDRKGDVQRSFVFALICILVSANLVIVGGTLLACIGVEFKAHLYLSDPNDPKRPTLDAGTEITIQGLADISLYSQSAPDRDMRETQGWVYNVTETRRVTYFLSTAPIAVTATFWVFAVFYWAVPALVGIWTQIRRGLPSFARAPRTIIAAANYEAHRLIYLGLVIVVAIGAEASLRIISMNGSPRVYVAGSAFLFWTTFLYAALAWAGPIRSDYTRQLIQSRRHAIRFILMYGFLFPFPLAGILIGVFFAILSVL